MSLTQGFLEYLKQSPITYLFVLTELQREEHVRPAYSCVIY